MIMNLMHMPIRINIKQVSKRRVYLIEIVLKLASRTLEATNKNIKNSIIENRNMQE